MSPILPPVLFSVVNYLIGYFFLSWVNDFIEDMAIFTVLLLTNTKVVKFCPAKFHLYSNTIRIRYFQIGILRQSLFFCFLNAKC